MQLSPRQMVLLDVEGTVGSIDYVRTVMFPYARERFAGWLDDLGRDVRDELLAQLRSICGDGVVDIATAAAALHDLTDRDIKAPVLKKAQEAIWRNGFRDGMLTGHLYPDVAPALTAWREADVGIFIYSSGTVAAQRDWFTYSTAGDLSSLITGYFDLTTAGPKNDAESYHKISASVRRPGEVTLFVSDAVAELRAAAAAGMAVVRAVRPGNATEYWDGTSVNTLSDIALPPVRATGGGAAGKAYRRG